MARFLGVRFAQMAFVFWLFLTLLFFMIELSPGDPTLHLVLDPNVPVEARDLLIRRLGLDRPLHERYLIYLRNFFTGDMGVSFSQYPREVTDILWERLPRTLMLFFIATVLAYWFGFAVGKVLAWKRGGGFEYAMTIVGVALFTVFIPWFALIMIWVFSFTFNLFPLRGFLTPRVFRGQPFGANEVFLWMIGSGLVLLLVLTALYVLTRRMNDFRIARVVNAAGSLLAIAAFFGYWWIHPMRTLAANIAHHTMLPVLTLTLIAFGGVMLLTRSSMLETLREDYILTARAKGLPEAVVRNRHAARTALLPVVTSMVLALATVIGGGIVTETIFSWPGIGLALLDGIVKGDTPLALGALAFIGVLALIGHLLVDILYGYLDPRIRH